MVLRATIFFFRRLPLSPPLGGGECPGRGERGSAHSGAKRRICFLGRSRCWKVGKVSGAKRRGERLPHPALRATLSPQGGEGEVPRRVAACLSLPRSAGESAPAGVREGVHTPARSAAYVSLGGRAAGRLGKVSGAKRRGERLPHPALRATLSPQGGEGEVPRRAAACFSLPRLAGGIAVRRTPRQGRESNRVRSQVFYAVSVDEVFGLSSSGMFSFLRGTREYRGGGCRASAGGPHADGVPGAPPTAPPGGARRPIKKPGPAGGGGRGRTNPHPLADFSEPPSRPPSCCAAFPARSSRPIAAAD
jgi:hypothetical protein